MKRVRGGEIDELPGSAGFFLAQRLQGILLRTPGTPSMQEQEQAEKKRREQKANENGKTDDVHLSRKLVRKFIQKGIKQSVNLSGEAVATKNLRFGNMIMRPNFCFFGSNGVGKTVRENCARPDNNGPH